MIKSFLFFLILSCSGVPKKDQDSRAPHKVHTFMTVREAQNYITNKSRYLNLLFEQSHDPYYNTPKWSEECLQRNRIGKIVNQNSAYYLSNHLVLSPSGDSGQCQGIDTHVIYLQCGESATVNEFHCSPGSCDSWLAANPCPQ